MCNDLNKGPCSTPVMSIAESLLEGLKQRVFAQFKAKDVIYHAYVKIDLNVNQETEDTLVYELRLQRHSRRIVEPFAFDLWMLCLIHRKDYYVVDETTQNLRRSDTVIPNLTALQILERALKKSDTITDENIIRSHDGSRVVSSQENAVEIFLIRTEDKIGIPVTNTSIEN